MVRVAATYLNQLAAADDPISAAAYVTLLKYGFNPAEPRAAGRWTAGGTTTTTSETSQRRQRERSQHDAKDHAEAAQQNTETANRIAGEDAKLGTHHQRTTTQALRHQYGIPTGPAYTHLSPAKKQAAQDLLSAANSLTRLQERRPELEARLAHVDTELGRPNATNTTQAMLARRRDTATRALANLDSRVRAARAALTAAVKAWGGKGKKTKSYQVTLTKAEDRIPKPGQRFWHGWVPVDEAAHDMLGYGAGRPRMGGTYHASHRIEGTSGVPVDVMIHSWEGDDGHEPPEVSIETTHPDTMTPSTSSLDAKGARQAADHLRDLATIADSGAKPTTTKPTKHSKSAALIQSLVERERISLDDKVNLYDDNDLSITYKDLLDLLAPHIPAPTVDEKRLRRVVKENRGNDVDPGDLHMHLDTTGAQPVIHVTVRERGEGPWDPATDLADERARQWMSTLTPNSARELADKLDQYANALPKG